MNRKLKGLGLILVILFYATGCVSNALTVSYKGSVSPNVYGLQQAKTGEERYEILLRTHKEAVQKGLMVDYRGIDTINLTIPKGAESIPLGPINDFNGAVFNVTNQNQDVYLFSYVNKAEPIDVPAHLIDKGLFLEIPRLNSGKKLLVIEDQNPWVENRKGYSYGHIRRDILLLKHGKAQNQTIMPYDNPQSLPKCKVYDLDIPYLKIENLILNRNDNSSYKTFLCNIVGTNNVQINNVTINTPQSDMVEDMAIKIVDCTNVSLNDVTINGTYSRSDYSGYGICMNNIWNFKVKELEVEANWGVFGDNNINVVSIENSKINRFDIHCYGRDVYFKNVLFFQFYNQFSSVFGSIEFDNCVFDDFTPIVYEYNYNTYNSHNVIFKNCAHNLSARRCYLINAGILSEEKNYRKELTVKYWPKLTINNMLVNVPVDVKDYCIYYAQKQGDNKAIVDYVSDIKIDRMDFKYVYGAELINMYLTNKEVFSKNPISVDIKNLNILTEEVENKHNSSIGNLIINIKGSNKSNKLIIVKSRMNNEPSL